jgi:hypothetical protein
MGLVGSDAGVAVAGTGEVGLGPTLSAEGTGLGVGGGVGLTVGSTVGVLVCASGAAQPPARIRTRNVTRYREYDRVISVCFRRMSRLRSVSIGAEHHYASHIAQLL